MAIDNHATIDKDIKDPGEGIFDVYAQRSDTDDLTIIPRALYCTTDGTIKVVDYKDNTVSIPVFAGVILPLRIKKLFSTGTSGITSLWGIY